jgi:predicted metal-binding membrane protein
MIAAMMLPTTAPLVSTFVTVVGGRDRPRRLLGLLVAGYVWTWTVVGAVAIGLDALLHRIADPPEHWSTSPVMVAIVALAGLYQFTPLKRRCLTECRSPYLFIAQRWHGRSANWEAFSLGTAHGWFCVGCCWTLMLVVFAIGMGNLGWMLILATVMAVEKNVPRFTWLSPLIGVVLIAVAGLLVLT